MQTSLSSMINILSRLATTDFVLLALTVLVARMSPVGAASLTNAKDMFYQELKQSSANSSSTTAASNSNTNTSATSTSGTTVAYCLELHRGSAPPVLCNNRYSFRNGDGIRLHLKTTASRYAYIVMMEGSSGKKALLYPPPGSSENNRLEAGKEVLVPPNGLIRFDSNPGTEKLALLLTPEPIDTATALTTPVTVIDGNSLTGIPENSGPYSVYSSDGAYNLGEKASGNGLVYVHNPHPNEATSIGIVLNHGSATTSVPIGTPRGIARPESLAAHSRPITDKWAFIVGVNKFAHFPDRELRYCVSDAKYLKDFLITEAGFKQNHVYFLSDEQATEKNIMRVMTELLPAAIRRDDLVLLYFSTHGTPSMKGENYIVTHDFNNDAQNGIPMAKLGDLIKTKVPSDRVITILDTCFSGNARSMDSKSALDELMVGSGQIIVSSCGPNETSLEDPTLKHGYFTYYLVNALRSNKFLKQSFDVSRDQVVSRTKADHNHQQHPIVNYDRWKGNDLPIQVPAVSPGE